MRIASFMAIMAAVTSFVVVPAAQAADPNLCPILRTVMNESVTHFKELRGKKRDTKDWLATSQLPYAEYCYIDADFDDKEVQYHCIFRLKTTGKAAHIAAAKNYAENLQACRPELTLRANPNTAGVYELYADTFMRIDLMAFDDFFNVVVYEPGRQKISL